MERLQAGADGMPPHSFVLADEEKKGHSGKQSLVHLWKYTFTLTIVYKKNVV